MTTLDEAGNFANSISFVGERCSIRSVLFLLWLNLNNSSSWFRRVKISYEAIALMGFKFFAAKLELQLPSVS